MYTSTNDKILAVLEQQQGNADRLAAQTAALEIAVREQTAEVGTLRRFLEGVAPLLTTHDGIDAAARLAEDAAASVSAADRSNQHLTEVRQLLERLASASETAVQSVAVPAARELTAVRKLLESLREEQTVGQTAALESSERLGAIVAALSELRAVVERLGDTPPTPDPTPQLERVHGEVVTLRRIGQEVAAYGDAVVKLLTPPPPEPSEPVEEEPRPGFLRRLFTSEGPSDGAQ